MSDAISISIPREYGFVLGAAIASGPVMFYLAIRVGKARKIYNVPYPIMYDEKKNDFNCYQRAHQNALEYYPIYLSCLLIGGIRHPLFASGCGFAWLVSRLIYAHGYYSGDPRDRLLGSRFALASLLGLFGSAQCCVFHTLQLGGYV